MLRVIGPLLPGINVFDVLWPHPPQPSEVASLYFMNIASLRPGPLLNNFQMLPFAINDPHITGYSVCWASRLFRLHAHREGEDMSFYRDLDASYD